jgi:hypothetical protein
MQTKDNSNGAAARFAAEDIINPMALARKLRSGEHPFHRRLLEKFSAQGRARLAALLGNGADPAGLAALIAGELNAIVACAQSLHDPGVVNGTPLRRSTRKLLKKNPQDGDLERLNTLLIQDVFAQELRHDSCELVDVVKKRGVEFRIYLERRKLKTKWNESYKITYRGSAGLTSTHARTLEEARDEIDGKIVDSVLSGEAPLTRQDRKELDAKAKSYDEIAAEVAKVGKTDGRDMVEFVKDAAKAQLKIGLERPLLDFVTHAVEVLVKPVTRCLLKPAAAAYSQFVLARKDVEKRAARRSVASVGRFAAAMLKRVHERNVRGLAPGSPLPEAPKDVYVDEPKPNEIQAWLNDRKIGWRALRDELDRARAFMAYCRDALHALPQGIKTAAHIVPRPKPDSDAEPVPAPVLSFRDVWRMAVNLQDLESLWFFAIAVFAGLHQSEILRLVWENDIKWDGRRPLQIFIASGKGKDKHGNRMGAYVDIRHPLDTILGLGCGRTGRIVHHKSLRQEKLSPLAQRLKIQWAESIMRHTFVSNFFGLGFSFEDVARQTRNTVTILKRHYYAPISKQDALRFFSLPIGMDRIEKLPFQRRFWNWKQLEEFDILPDGTTSITQAPTGQTAGPSRPSQPLLKKREQRIAWPDDLELQVALWEKSQEQIGRELNCRQTTVSGHALRRGLVTPKSDYLLRLKHGLPVEIPEAVVKARKTLAARKKAAEKSGESGAAPASNSREPETQDQKPPLAPDNPALAASGAQSGNAS